MYKSSFFETILVFLVTSSVAFYSCDKDKTKPEIPKVPEIPSYLEIPQTAAEANALVNGVYGPLQTLSSSYSFLLESATETTISFEGNDNAAGPLISVLDITPANSYAIKLFNAFYRSIGTANLAIESIAFSELNDEVKDLLIARARFIRGFSYFQLVQLYGEVPLILSSDPEEIAATGTTRRSIDEVYAQVVDDLTESLAGLPEWDAQKSNPSQLAAKTILAKAYLTWGQKPLTQAEVEAIETSKTDPAKPAIDEAKLQQSLALANEVINSGRYSLLPNFNDIWGVANENNAEVIFSIHHLGDGIDAQGNHQTHCGYTYPGDERRDPHISYADISYENVMPDNDRRKEYSYVTLVEFENPLVKDTVTWPLSIVRPGKWIHRNAAGLALTSQPNNIDHIDFRLGEVYLIKAEAAFFLGNTTEALQAINALRSRAGVTHRTSLTVEDLYNEWEAELAHEQKHWLNLVRWRTYLSTVLTKVPTFEYYKDAYANEAQFNALPDADPDRFAFYQRVNLHLHKKVENIRGHHYRFPIPLGTGNVDLGIRPQNPGY